MKNEPTIPLCEFDETMRLILESGGQFRMYPRGSSMLPLLKEERDSVVLVAFDSAHPPATGSILLYRRDNGQYVLHRIIRQTEETPRTYTLCGDNQVIPETGITEDQIIGVVKCYYRKDKLRDAFSYSDRLYRWIWQSFLLRRIWQKLRRCLPWNKIYN